MHQNEQKSSPVHFKCTKNLLVATATQSLQQRCNLLHIKFSMVTLLFACCIISHIGTASASISDAEIIVHDDYTSPHNPVRRDADEDKDQLVHKPSKSNKKKEYSDKKVTGKAAQEKEPHSETDLETNESLGEDYDIALDLQEQEEFDRLLDILSRSGPAKFEGGKVSCYLMVV